MMSDAKKFYENWASEMAAVKEIAPDIGRSFGPFFQGLMKDGALSAKHKELIALGIAVAVRCESCIYSHVEKCVKHGATDAEVTESAGVSVMMGGGPAYTYLPIVVSALKQLRAAE
jgi:AhpD family alkylhydroperoxidase